MRCTLQTNVSFFLSWVAKTKLNHWTRRVVSTRLITYGVALVSRLKKIQVSFAKEPYKTDDILQKRPIILRSLLTVATPFATNHVATNHVATNHIEPKYLFRSRPSFGADPASG